MKKISLIFLSFFSLLLLAITGCTPLKDLQYLQEKADTSSVKIGRIPQVYRLQVKDGLYIKIQSTDEKSTELFNSGMNTGYGTYATQEVLNTYEINDSGFVHLPMLGKVSLVGKTIEEARSYIQQLISSYLFDATVVCKLASYKITLLGEVKSPGLKTVAFSKLNLLEVIALGGDLTIYGNRKDISIIRANEDGSSSIIRNIDITDSRVINMPEYTIKPNDVIYVPSLKNKIWGITTVPGSISTIVSLVTLIFVSANYFK